MFDNSLVMCLARGSYVRRRDLIYTCRFSLFSFIAYRCNHPSVFLSPPRCDFWTFFSLRSRQSRRCTAIKHSRLHYAGLYVNEFSRILLFRKIRKMRLTRSAPLQSELRVICRVMQIVKSTVRIQSASSIISHGIQASPPIVAAPGPSSLPWVKVRNIMELRNKRCANDAHVKHKVLRDPSTSRCSPIKAAKREKIIRTGSSREREIGFPKGLSANAPCGGAKFIART